MSRENLQTLLERVGQQLNLEQFQLDADDYCFAQVDGKIDLSIEFDEETQSAVLTASCGKLPEESAPNRAAVLQDLLDANYYWAGSGGATLSTNSRQGTAYLQFREPTGQLDQQRLEQLLQALVNGAEFWLERLGTQEGGASNPPNEDGGLGGFHPPLIHLA